MKNAEISYHLLVIAVFFTAMSIGLYFGHQYWEKHKKPMVDELNNLLSETEN